MKNYNIKEPSHIFNIDQTGASFGKMTGRSPLKGVSDFHIRALVQRIIRTKGDLTLVTVQDIVSASCVAYKPCVIYPGKNAHFRRVRGEKQTLHAVLMPCYLYHREVPGADSNIVFDWATGFLE